MIVMVTNVAGACQAASNALLFSNLAYNTVVTRNLSPKTLFVVDKFVLPAGRRLLFENAQQSLKAIQSLPSYQHVVLQPFTLEEVQQYMCVALDRHNITDQIAAAVHERTGGLPLYVEQVNFKCHCCTHMHELAWCMWHRTSAI